MSGLAYVVKDPWERFIYSFGEALKGGVEIKVLYDGIEAGVSLDRKALERLASLFEKGVPLEVALGIDLPRILSSLKGEELVMSFRLGESELTVKLTGDVLESFRNAMQSNPLDGETIRMLGRLIRRVIE